VVSYVVARLHHSQFARTDLCSRETQSRLWGISIRSVTDLDVRVAVAIGLWWAVLFEDKCGGVHGFYADNYGRRRVCSRQGLSHMAGALCKRI
jgi:hypothetical protein